MSNDASKTALVVSAAAAIAAAGALIATRPASAKTAGVVTLDEVSINLLIAIAQGIENLNSQIVQGGLVQGWPPNTENIEIARIDIGAVNTAYRLPDIDVPDGFTLIIKAWPTNGGIVYVAKSDPDARNINQVFPLLPNDVVGVNIKNAKSLYISGTNAGDFATILVEQRGNG